MVRRNGRDTPHRPLIAINGAAKPRCQPAHREYHDRRRSESRQPFRHHQRPNDRCDSSLGNRPRTGADEKRADQIGSAVLAERDGPVATGACGIQADERIACRGKQQRVDGGAIADRKQLAPEPCDQSRRQDERHRIRPERSEPFGTRVRDSFRPGSARSSVRSDHFMADCNTKAA